MKHYVYVTIQTNRFIGAKCEEHQQIIDEHAAKGYRYVGWIPTKMSDYGKIKELDLIFEQEENGL